MPRSGWFAVGAVAAAILGPASGRPASIALVGLALVALALVGGAGGLGRSRRRPASPAAVIAVGLGVAFVALRLAGGPGTASPAATLPTGEGPWSATIVSVGSPRTGQQVASVALDGSPGLRISVQLPRYPIVGPGDAIVMTGRIEAPSDDEYGAWLRRSGQAGTLRAGSMDLAAPATGPAAIIGSVRRASDAALAAALPEPQAGLASGILVGLRERVDRDLAAAFTTAGVSHVVAISGWNIAIVAAAVGTALRRSRRRRRSVVTAAAIVAYTVFAGASPSVVRAAAMAGIVLAARESGRAGRASAALGLAVGLLLLVDPSLVTDAGFQLSVLATAGLLVWGATASRLIERTGRGRLPGWLVETLALSLAAQLATLPVILATFGRLSLVAPFANLLVAPIVPPAMAAGAVALGAGALANAGAPSILATFLGLPGWAALAAMIAVVHAAAAAPLATVTLPGPVGPLAGVAAGAVAAALVPGIGGRVRSSVGPWLRSGIGRGGTARHAAARILSRPGSGTPGPRAASGTRRRPSRWRRVVAIGLAGAVTAVVLAAAHRPDGQVRFTVLDVGQGDAILVEGDRGGRMLVDGGPDPDRLLVALDERLPPWDRRIDLVVLTHPHEDHVGGLPLLLERYRVGRLLEPGMRGPGPGYDAWTAWLRDHQTVTGRLATGDRLTLDSIAFRVLWPDPGRVPSTPTDSGRSINDVSIVLLGTVGTGRFLLTGDIEDDVDPILIARGLPHVDVLKAAHHGSATSSTDAFLEAVRPEVAIVSVGARNPYGHPAPSTIERLESAGARTLRTDLDGSVTAAFDGRAWSIGTAHPRVVDAGALLGAPGLPGPLAITCRIPRPRQVATPGLVTAAAGQAALGYHRLDDPPRAEPGPCDAPGPRSAILASAPLGGGRGGRGLARRPGRGARGRGRPAARRGGRPPARRRQARAGPDDDRRAAAWPRRGGLARAPGLARAGPGGGRPSGLAARGRRVGVPLAGDGAARGAARRVRRQARRPAARVAG